MLTDKNHTEKIEEKTTRVKKKPIELVNAITDHRYRMKTKKPTISFFRALTSDPQTRSLRLYSARNANVIHSQYISNIKWPIFYLCECATRCQLLHTKLAKNVAGEQRQKRYTAHKHGNFIFVLANAKPTFFMYSIYQ